MSTTIRCKFKVQSITHSLGYGLNKETGVHGPMMVATPRLTVVTDGSPENKAFFASTPSGTIDVSMIHMEHAAAFAVGKELYVDFTPV